MDEDKSLSDLLEEYTNVEKCYRLEGESEWRDSIISELPEEDEESLGDPDEFDNDSEMDDNAL